MPKSDWKSKTLWWHWLIVILSAALLIGNAVTDGSLKLPIQLDGEIVALVLGIVAIILRYLTNQPVAGDAPTATLLRLFGWRG